MGYDFEFARILPTLAARPPTAHGQDQDLNHSASIGGTMMEARTTNRGDARPVKMPGNDAKTTSTAEVGNGHTSKAAHRPTRRVKKPGMRFDRCFTRPGIDPLDEVRWELRDASIKGADGKVYFEQKQVEFPTCLLYTSDAADERSSV